jgi:hypothetical protein
MRSDIYHFKEGRSFKKTNMDFNDDNHVSNLIRDGNWNQLEDMLTNRLYIILPMQKWQILKNAPISTIQTLMQYESNFNRKKIFRQKSLSDFNILLNIMNAAHGRSRESIFLRVLKIWIDHHHMVSFLFSTFFI